MALVMVFITLFACAAAQQNKVMEYGVIDGLPQDYVYSLHQDDAGYLWIGTGDGLARYDGNTFEVFNISDSLCSNFISCSYGSGRNHGSDIMKGGFHITTGRCLPNW